jgi:heme oxygenase
MQLPRDAATPDGSGGLAAALRHCTHALHVRAERTGVIRDILLGRGSRFGYAMLLRNLLPAYRRIEAGLERHRHSPLLAAFARPELYRSAAIESDLVTLYGTDWQVALPLLHAGDYYGACVGDAAAGDGARLIAHAYVRYLGDLSGGQVLQSLLAASLGVAAASLAFHSFPGIADRAAFKDELRASIDAVAERLADPDAVLAEAVLAFQLNIDISEGVQAAVAGTA